MFRFGIRGKWRLLSLLLHFFHMFIIHFREVVDVLLLLPRRPDEVTVG